MNLRGFISIGEFNGNETFWSPKSDQSYYNLNKKVMNKVIDFSTLTISEIARRNNLLEKQQSPYRFWKETTGLQNVILYNTNLLYLQSGVLCSYDVDYAELPINCSSCNFMFSHLTIKNPKMFLRRFDMSNVVSALGMFSSSVFGNGLTFGKSFNTVSIVDARFMFSGVHFGTNVSLGESFTSASMENVSYMFAYSVFERGFYLPKTFRLEDVDVQVGVFKHCVFKSCVFTENKNTILNEYSDEDVMHLLQTRGT